MRRKGHGQYKCRRDHRPPKHIPYGQIRTKNWCDHCDAFYGPLLVTKENKKRERQKEKKEIEDQRAD